MAGEILEVGYEPVEATVDPVAVDVDVDADGGPSLKFSDHFKVNAGMDPDHYINPAVTILFAGMSHTHKHVINRTEHIYGHGSPNKHMNFTPFAAVAVPFPRLRASWGDVCVMVSPR